MMSNENIESGLGRRIAAIIEMYKTRKLAGEISGVTVEQLGRYEREETKAPFKVLARLAVEKNVSLNWLATGDGNMFAENPIVARVLDQPWPSSAAHSSSPGESLAVLGLAECGLEGWFNEGALAVRAARPGDLADPEAFAVMATGDSMVPAGIMPGFLCICSPRTPYDPGDAVVIERNDGKATIKVLQKFDADWLYLMGYLAPDEAGDQKPFTDQLSRSTIRRIATIVYVKRKL